MTIHKLYKLTDRNNQTKNGTRWGEGVTHQTTGIPAELCSVGWLHAYEHPLLAVLFNPIHADFENPRLWEADGEGELLREGQLKCGVTKLTTTREIPLPEVTTEQRVRFAILCAKTVCKDEQWNKWADKWMSGEDRSEEAAWAAWGASSARAERAARAWAAREAAARAAAAAEAAAEAAWAAACAEETARAARAAWAARAAREAAARAAWGAWAARVNSTLDLLSIAKQACAWKGE